MIIGALSSLALDHSLLFLVSHVGGSLALALGWAGLLLRRALIFGVVGRRSIWACVSLRPNALVKWLQYRKLTILALTTTCLLLAGWSDWGSTLALVSGGLCWRGGARSLLVTGEFVQQATDACPGARDVAETTEAGELLDVKLSARVSDWSTSSATEGFGMTYFWFSLQAAVVDAELLHLTVGKRGGGCFRRHDGGVVLDTVL
jgi:hypothetical protein